MDCCNSECPPGPPYEIKKAIQLAEWNARKAYECRVESCECKTVSVNASEIAQNAAADAEESASESQAILDDFQQQYMGSYPSPPATITIGSLYFDTTSSQMFVWNGTVWQPLVSSTFIPDGDKGDITTSGLGAAWTIDNDVVTFAKMQNISTDRLLGRATAGAGDIEEIVCTAAGRALLDDVDAAAQRTTLGLSGFTTGSVDNAVLRADGTGGITSQSSDLVIDDATTTTQNNVAIRNNHSETNSALVLTPKGTGAFIVGPKPDGTATGGNARGASAIDIATSRSAASQVASGANAILIGSASTASTADAIAIGRNVISSGTFTTAIGYAASATNTRSTAYGNSAICTGSLAVALGPEISVSASEAIGIGWGAIASATRAVCVASDNTANLRAGFFTWPFRSVYWSGQTTTNAATILNLDGTATNRFTIAASTALAVDILLVARRATTQDKWLVARRFLGIRRDGSNNTSLIGSVQTLGTDQSTGSPTWTFALTADDTNEALQLQVTGATSETVEWRATAIYRVA